MFTPVFNAKLTMDPHESPMSVEFPWEKRTRGRLPTRLQFGLSGPTSTSELSFPSAFLPDNKGSKPKPPQKSQGMPWPLLAADEAAEARWLIRSAAILLPLDVRRKKGVRLTGRELGTEPSEAVKVLQWKSVEALIGSGDKYKERRAEGVRGFRLFRLSLFRASRRILVFSCASSLRCFRGKPSPVVW
mmetsp:Transcript_7200/g.14118  ORF Transcript_7200/g.14118 Transcript_7200/m.14118 type:complete len:188 (+) Transcript_7200:946-1509(+)